MRSQINEMPKLCKKTCVKLGYFWHFNDVSFFAARKAEFLKERKLFNRKIVKEVYVDF
jgi:hypothetical protein